MAILPALATESAASVLEEFNALHDLDVHAHAAHSVGTLAKNNILAALSALVRILSSLACYGCLLIDFHPWTLLADKVAQF